MAYLITYSFAPKYILLHINGSRYFINKEKIYEIMFRNSIIIDTQDGYAYSISVYVNRVRICKYCLESLETISLKVLVGGEYLYSWKMMQEAAIKYYYI